MEREANVDVIRRGGASGGGSGREQVRGECEEVSGLG